MTEYIRLPPCYHLIEMILTLLFVGGHGAGLTNMIFAPRNASVVEFGLTPHIDRCFGYMAVALGMDYWLLPQISTHLYLKYTLTVENVGAAVRLVRHLLEQKGLTSLITQPSEALKPEAVSPKDKKKASKSSLGKMGSIAETV